MRSSVCASMPSVQLSGQPTCRRPMPRWLCVATGTSLKMRSMSSSEKPSARRRSRERSATSSWAQGQAVMPCASTPIRRRVPRAEATAEPSSV